MVAVGGNIFVVSFECSPMRLRKIVWPVDLKYGGWSLLTGYVLSVFELYGEMILFL